MAEDSVVPPGSRGPFDPQGSPPVGIILYGVTIHGSIAGGDLGKMKEVAGQAERWLAEHGDVAAALEVLKAEIAKKEAGKA